MSRRSNKNRKNRNRDPYIAKADRKDFSEKESSIPKAEIFNNIDLTDNDKYLLDLEMYLLTKVNKDTILEIKYRDLPESVLAKLEKDDDNFTNLKLISIAIVVIIQKIINVQFSDKDTERTIIRVFYNFGIMEKLKNKPLFAKLAESNSTTVADDLMDVISKYTKNYTYKSDIRKFTENINKKASVKAYAKEVINKVLEKAEVIQQNVGNKDQEQEQKPNETSQHQQQTPKVTSINYDAKKTLAQNQRDNITNIQDKETSPAPAPAPVVVNKPKGDQVYKRSNVKTIAMRLKEGTLTEKQKEILAPVINNKKLTEEELLERSNTDNANELAEQIATGKVRDGIRDVFGWLGKEGKNDALDDFIKKISG